MDGCCGLSGTGGGVIVVREGIIVDDAVVWG